MHHARKRHVHERVDPERRQQEEDLPYDDIGHVLLVVRAEDVEDEGDCLPGGGHDEDPGVSLIYPSLSCDALRVRYSGCRSVALAHLFENKGFDDVSQGKQAEERGDYHGGDELGDCIV